ncbi:MAG: T9SS type A sorting domain-containing protein [Lewinellaceae bacterium]|nr:T9SS type A sorting domain-containing protein [Lewinellaceae bacterium]
MKYFSTVFAALCLPFLAAAQDVVTGTINHDGLSRSYRLYIPPANASGEGLPLVFNFHGYGSNAFQQELYSGMNEVADTAGFFVCYPNGVASAWNVGWDFGSTADDVGLTAALIDELSENYNIDPRRVYACGMSNGGFMSYRLACELNSRIAAIASVTGSMVPGYLGSCSPGRAVPVLEIHGTADAVVPYEGQANLCVNIDTVVHFWATNNSCDPVPVAQDLPDTAPLDGSTATRVDYNNCEGDRQVSLFRIKGGGHTWPGAAFSIGVTNQDIDASVEIWRFFNRFVLEEATAAGEAADAGPIVRFFPNPTNGLLHIETRGASARLAACNAYGQLVYRTQLAGDKTLDISGWEPGIYFLTAETNEGIMGFRIVKQ